jgi:AcrR family transcriptional regulator
MTRWEPDAQERLQQAAVALFAERGYADVTVAEIADRAGLTKRSFFNHFADKREVLFAGAQAFQAGVIAHLAEAGDDLSAIDAAVSALTRGGLDLAQLGDYALARRELIASSPDLQERNLIKMASLAAAIAEALRARHAPDRTATLAAQAAVAVFTAAYDDWAGDTTADFAALMQRSLSGLREAVCRADASPCRNG